MKPTPATIARECRAWARQIDARDQDEASRLLVREAHTAVATRTLTWWRALHRRVLVDLGDAEPATVRPSGASGASVPRDQRKRRPVEITLDADVLARTDDAAREAGQTRSAYVEGALVASLPQTKKAAKHKSTSP